MICDHNKGKRKDFKNPFLNFYKSLSDFVWKFPLRNHFFIIVRGNVLLFGYGRFDFLG